MKKTYFQLCFLLLAASHGLGAGVGTVNWTINYQAPFEDYSGYTVALVYYNFDAQFEYDIGTSGGKTIYESPTLHRDENGVTWLDQDVSSIQGVANFTTTATGKDFTESGSTLAIDVIKWADPGNYKLGSVTTLNPERWDNMTTATTAAPAASGGYIAGSREIPYYMIVFKGTTIDSATEYAVITSDYYPLSGDDAGDGLIPNPYSGTKFNVSFTFNPKTLEWVPVPEPATLLLLGVGCALIGLRRKPHVK